MSLKLNLEPLIFDLEKVNAAIEPTQIETITVTTVINKVLKKYLESGTSKLLNNAGKTLKLSNVGRATQKRGGKINNSSKGFNEVIIQ
jgi:hypothetical protein